MRGTPSKAIYSWQRSKYLIAGYRVRAYRLFRPKDQARADDMRALEMTLGLIRGDAGQPDAGRSVSPEDLADGHAGQLCL
jgi:hypothetical protein